jgi:hypothetical protein
MTSANVPYLKLSYDEPDDKGDHSPEEKTRKDRVAKAFPELSVHTRAMFH